MSSSMPSHQMNAPTTSVTPDMPHPKWKMLGGTARTGIRTCERSAFFPNPACWYCTWVARRILSRPGRSAWGDLFVVPLPHRILGNVGRQVNYWIRNQISPHGVSHLRSVRVSQHLNRRRRAIISRSGGVVRLEGRSRTKRPVFRNWAVYRIPMT